MSKVRNDRAAKRIRREAALPRLEAALEARMQGRIPAGKADTKPARMAAITSLGTAIANTKAALG